MSAPVVPPKEHRGVRWHWLRHELTGTLIVKEWIEPPHDWIEGLWGDAPLGGGGATATRMAKWGWRHYAPCLPPPVA